MLSLKKIKKSIGAVSKVFNKLKAIINVHLKKHGISEISVINKLSVFKIYLSEDIVNDDLSHNSVFLDYDAHRQVYVR